MATTGKASKARKADPVRTGDDPVQQEITQIEKLLAQLSERVANLKARVAAEPTSGQQAKKLLDWYVVEWGKVYQGEKYVVAGAKEMDALKRLLRTLTAHEIAVRARRYLGSRDRLAVESKHAIGVFASSINRYGNTQAVSPQGDEAAKATSDYLRQLQRAEGR